MARTNDSKTNQWKPLDLDAELTGLVQGLSVLSGAPSVITPPLALSPQQGKISPYDGAAEKGKENKKSKVVSMLKRLLRS
jgi:hypothetical protein